MKINVEKFYCFYNIFKSRIYINKNPEIRPILIKHKYMHKQVSNETKSRLS